jgi:Ca2+-binding RTX toxin-like protein
LDLNKVDQSKLTVFQSTTSQPPQNPNDPNDFLNLFYSFIADGVFGIDTSSLTDPKTGNRATLQLESYNTTTGAATGRAPTNNTVTAGNINNNAISVTFNGGGTSFQSFINSLTQNYANTSFSISLSQGLVSTSTNTLNLELASLTAFFNKQNRIVEILVPNTTSTIVAFFTQQQAADLDASSLIFKYYNPSDLNAPPTLYTSTIQFSGINNNNLKDNIVGTIFNDFLNGQSGTDSLNGFSGNDTILGGNGQDMIVGGDGNDILQGEGSQDKFIFGKSFGEDTIGGRSPSNTKIVDFSNDQIDLTALSITYQQIQGKSSVINGDLFMDLRSFGGGTITVTGITALASNAFIL